MITPCEQNRVDWIDNQHAIAERDYLQLLEDTGRMLTPKEWGEKDKKFSQTQQMTRDLADRLTRNGIPMYSECDPIQIIGAHTEIVRELPNFKQCNMLPASAQKKRNPMLNMLQYYTQARGMKNFRHIVLHKGPRCTVDKLAERYQEMKKLFNSWNKHYAAKYDAEFIFYSCEAGSPVKKAAEKIRGIRPYILDTRGKRIRQVNELGQQTYHPHIHALLEMGSYLDKPIFEKMCEDLRHCFGDLEYLYNAPIENTREVCKYIVKCDELMDLKDPDLVAYYKATHGLRTIQSMGDFAAFKKALKADGRTIRTRVNYKTGRAEFVPMKNWNRSFAGDIHERTSGERLEKNIRDTIDGPSGPLTRPALIARMAPSYLNSPVAEPLFMVRGRCHDIAEFRSRRKIAAVIETTRSDFLAGWQDFRNEYGVSLEQWVNGTESAILAAAAKHEGAGTVADFADFFAQDESAPQVSAHNTSTTGRNHPPLHCPPKAIEENASSAKHPKGGQSPFSRTNQASSQPEEPAGAFPRNQNTQIAGSPCPLDEVLQDYF